MLALSVRQPWAWAIGRGHKTVENRDWDTRFRGTLAIHASLSVDLGSSDRPAVRAAGWDPGDPVAAIGGIVAVVRLLGVCSAAMPGSLWSGSRSGPASGSASGWAGWGPGGACGCGAWANPGEYHWQLGAPRPLPRPVMAIGEGGLWELPPAVAAEVTRLLSAAPERPPADRLAGQETRRPRDSPADGLVGQAAATSHMTAESAGGHTPRASRTQAEIDSVDCARPAQAGTSRLG